MKVNMFLQNSEQSGEWRAITQAARTAYRTLALTSDDQRNTALRTAAVAMRARQAKILAANAKDIAAAQHLSAAMIDRLTLDAGRVEAMAKGLEQIAELPDLLGKVQEAWDRPNGLHIQKVTIPLGVIGIIYESRPNVTADAAGLCIKSGNAAILRGGSESFYSAQAIHACLQEGLQAAGLPQATVQLIPDTDRAWVSAMLTAHGQIDVIIPRGGKSLTERVAQESRVPTLLHLDGNCHMYIHAAADKAKAIALLVNAKMRRTGICGATESLVIDRAILAWLPELVDALHAAGCLEFRGDAEACEADDKRSLTLLAPAAHSQFTLSLEGEGKAAAQPMLGVRGEYPSDPRITPATEDDWGTEYLAPVISLKTVSGVGEAVAHINQYGSHHTDSIVTEDAAAAAQFQREVDSAIVMHNTSTQFADGGEFGFGAEIGIATGRLHARGPVGAAQLTTYKYVVGSAGAVRK